MGDFILVNKFTYGIRLPVANVKLFEVNQPKRGDVMVFRFPEDTSLDYIKRVVGLPGDVVEYRNKHLTINGRPVPQKPEGEYAYVKSGLNYVNATLKQEDLDGHAQAILVVPEDPTVRPAEVHPFPGRENCVYNEDGFRCTVPAGHYFMMGDNRDDSNDSRYWGFVPDRNIVGKAFLIWLNFSDFSRVGRSVQ